MAKKFGEIELGGTLGGYEIINQPADKLPQDLASAISIVNSNPLLGATYNPLWLWGKQPVRGENHYILCEAKVIYPGAQPHAISLGINIFEGKPTVVSILPLSSGTKDSLTLFGYAFTW